MNRAQLLLFTVLLLAVAAIGDDARTFAQTTPSHRAALLVQYGEGRTETYCARFSEDAITGEQMLRRVGLTARMEATTMGYAICMIGEQGCRFPAESCFCRCQTLGADCTFWNYLQRTDAGWRAVPAGVSAPIVVDGSVFAWSWNAGDGENVSVSLPPVDVDVVCGRTPTDEEATADRRPPTTVETTDDGRRTTAETTIEPTAEETTAEPTADRRPTTAEETTVQPKAEATDEATTDDGRRTTAETTVEPTADRRPTTDEATTDDGRPTTAEPTADRRPPTAEATTDDGRPTTAETTVEPNQGLSAFVATAAVLVAVLLWLRKSRGKS